MPDKGVKDICFFISPIGDEGSPARKRSDDVFEFIIEPAASTCGLTPVRADRIDESGYITNQVISHLVSDKIVVADFWSLNPNVFYELAIRHAFKLPVIHLYLDDIPFDVKAMRAIRLDHQDSRSWEEAKGHVRQQMQAALQPDFVQETPFSIALDIDSLRSSGSSTEELLAEILELVSSRGLAPDDPAIDHAGRARMAALGTSAGPHIASIQGLVRTIDRAPRETRFIAQGYSGDSDSGMVMLFAVGRGATVPFFLERTDFESLVGIELSTRAAAVVESIRALVKTVQENLEVNGSAES